MFAGTLFVLALCAHGSPALDDCKPVSTFGTVEACKAAAAKADRLRDPVDGAHRCFDLREV